jgi:hypothetical protein
VDAGVISKSDLPELVEGLFFFSSAMGQKKERGFDKLSQAGFLKRGAL